MGQYIMSALDCTVCNNSFWKGKNGTPSKYIEKPFLQKAFENDGLTQEEIDNREIQKMLLNEQLWANNHKKKLPTTVIK